MEQDYREQEWMNRDGIAMIHNEQVITSQPIVIDHEGEQYAGWLWSDGVRTFAHNTAGSAFKLA